MGWGGGCSYSLDIVELNVERVLLPVGDALQLLQVLGVLPHALVVITKVAQEALARGQLLVVIGQDKTLVGHLKQQITQTQE